MSIDKKAFGISDSLVNAVSEALKGNQTKLDKNHNGKLDGQDFKILRKEEVVDEGNPANKEKKNAAAAAVGAKNRDSHYLDRMNPAVADKIRGREKMSGKDRQQHEEVEQVDEKAVSKAQQHAAGAALATQRGEYAGGKKGGAINRMASMKTSELRKFAGTKTKGLPTHKEEVEQVDELSKKTLGSYIKKAATDVATNSAATGRHAERSNKIAAHQKKTGDYSQETQRRKDSQTADKAFDKSWKRRQGINKATDKLTKEEAEQVDELSRKTLGSYAYKADKQLGKVDANGPSHKAGIPSHYRGINKTLGKNPADKMRARKAGIKLAVKKLAKEEIEPEPVNELSTDTYHSAAHKAAKKAMGDAQGRSGPIFKKYAGMANKFRDKGMSQEKKEKASKDAKSAKIKAYRADRDKHMEEEIQIDEISKKLAARYNNKVARIVSKNQNSGGDPDKLRQRKNREAGHKLSWNKYHNYKVKVPATEETDPRDSRPETHRTNNTGYAWDKLSTRSQSNPKDSKATKSGKQLGLKHSIKGALGSHGPKGKLPEETDPGFAEAAENPMAKQLADKKASIQKTIAQKKMQVMQAKANKQISSMKEAKCTCTEGKKSMTCEVCNDKSKGMKGGKEAIQMNPPLRD